MRSCALHLACVVTLLLSFYPVFGADAASREELTGGKQEKSTEEMLKEMGDDEILVKIDGRDALKWGLLRRHVEALCSGVDRPEMQVEGNSALRSIMFQEQLRKLLKEYIQYSLFAAEARREGVTVAPETFAEYRAKAHAGYAKMGERGKAVLKLIDSGESFYELNLTNALYSQAYQTQVILPLAETNDEEVKHFMEMVHSNNTAVVATNLYKKALVVDILGKLKGGMDFGDAAEKWSECDSAETRGVVMDDNGEHPARFSQGDLPNEIEDALAKLKEGETSGIIETPFDWRIVKLLKRNGSPEQGDEVTVEVAQIQLEKVMLDPEPSPSQAVAKIKQIKVKAMMRVKFYELIRKAQIESKIPLWASGDSAEGGMRMKRVQ